MEFNLEYSELDLRRMEFNLEYSELDLRHSKLDSGHSKSNSASFDSLLDPSKEGHLRQQNVSRNELDLGNDKGDSV